MNNPYEEGSVASDLHELGGQLASEAEDSDEMVNATDRRTAALYRIGAALVANLGELADSRTAFSIAEDLQMELFRISGSISEIAEAIKENGSS